MRQKELQEEEAALDMDDGASDTKDGSRMLRDEVTPDDIASVVASWTGAFFSQVPALLTERNLLTALSLGGTNLCAAISLLSRYPSRQAHV